MNIFSRLLSNDTTTTWSQSATASCTGWFCRASANNVIAPTVADEIAGMMALVAAGCAMILIVAFVGWLAGWWGRGGHDA
jgi:cell division protein FtsX